jgi:sec-independent protein translocase protein TatC
MSVLEHLDELRSRLLRAVLGFVVVFGLTCAVARPALEFFLRPIRASTEVVFITLTEPFAVYMKASALLAVFVSAPWLLYQAWAFVAPGLHKNERRAVLPFLVFGTLFFVGGGAFGYYVALPIAVQALVNLGQGFRGTITLSSAFAFESALLLAMGLIFELPIVIYFLTRLGLVTPRFLLRHFRIAVLVGAVLAAVLTPTGDMVTMTVFLAPMVLLYLIGVGVSWFVRPRHPARGTTS